MPHVTIRLTDDEYRLLGFIAESERRSRPDQVARMLAHAMAAWDAGTNVTQSGIAAAARISAKLRDFDVPAPDLAGGARTSRPQDPLPIPMDDDPILCEQRPLVHYGATKHMKEMVGEG